MSSCIGCLKKYGIFNKEVGCPNCKFSFCSKCLKYQIQLPHLNGAKKKVCLGCYERLSNPEKYVKKSTTVTDLLDKTFEEEEKLPPPVELDKDKLIADKLEALKKAETPVDSMSDEDIAARLSRLRGVEFKDYSQNMKSLVNAVDSRTDQEKINDLLKQFEEESNLNTTSKKDPALEIEEKLNQLRGEQGATGGVGKPKNFAEVLEEEESNAETIKKIVAKAIEESLIDDNLTLEAREYLANIPKPLDSTVTEELPWCTICNEDANVRCLECDGELFCRACFRECHDDDEDYRSHRTETYVKPKEAAEN